MSSSMTDRQAELIIILPTGNTQDTALDFVGRCLIYGFDFYFESGDRLPTDLPEEIDGVRAVVYDESTTVDPAALARYEHSGARIYRLKTAFDITHPGERRYWELGHLQDMLAMDAGLTLHSRHFHARMQARDEDFLLTSLGQGVMRHEETRWCEPARHQWEALLDGYEVTGSPEYLEAVQRQAETALEVENKPENCDAMAPIRALARLYEHTGDQRLLRRSMQITDGYLETAPRYKGCFIGFHWLSNHARAEIIFQVCPSLIYLFKVSGEQRYLDAVLDQYRRYEGLLHDPETGYWYHGAGKSVRTTANWSRGVAFILLGILQSAEHVPDACAEKPDMVDTVRRMAANLCEYQDKTGFWRKVIDEPATQFESSGTAWMGTALERGMRLGWLEPSYREAADRAWDAVKTRIFQGRFPGTVGATTVSPDRGYYLRLPLNPTGLWSHFAFKFACERRRSDV